MKIPLQKPKLLSDNPAAWLTTIVFTLATCFFIGVLIYMIVNNGQDITYDDTIHATYTFEKALTNYGKTTQGCQIYVEEEELPLFIDSILLKELNDNALSSFARGGKIDCYMLKSSNKKHAYKLVEVSQGGLKALSLADANKAYANNQTLGLIVLPIMIVLSAGLTSYGIVSLIRLKQKEQLSLKNSTENDLL